MQRLPGKCALRCLKTAAVHQQPADASLEEGTHPLGAPETDPLNLLGLLDRPRSSLPSGSSRPRRFLVSGGRRSLRLGRHFAAIRIK